MNKPKARDFEIGDPITEEMIDAEIEHMLREMAKERIESRRQKAWDDAWAEYRWAEATR